MKQVILDIPDNKLPFFFFFINNLGFVKKIEIDDEPTKDQILDNIKAGLKEVQLFKNGKLSTTSAKDFLNEV
mgnify:CR=1 FL=1